MHCDGADGSTDIIDSSSVGRKVTAEVDAAISADLTAFGGTSAFINGGSLYVDNSPDLQFDLADFTIEAWVKFTEIDCIQCLFCSDSAAINNNAIFIRVESSNKIFATAGDAGGIYSTTEVESDTRYHIAVVRASLQLYLFVNGNLEATVIAPYAITDALRWFGNYSLLAWENGYDGAVRGYMEEIRVTAWARYTESFTPPAEPFPDSSSLPPIWIETRYRCYLTGAENGLATDVELPISSFQTRISSESVSYLSCVLKGADQFVDAIAQRQAGKLKIWRIYVLSDGTESPFLMAEVAFEQMDLATGGRSGVTAQLSGTGNMVPQTPQSIALQNPSYFGLSGGKRRYRCEIDPRLRPGDTAAINDDTFVVGSITHIVDVKTAIMEIAEA